MMRKTVTCGVMLACVGLQVQVRVEVTNNSPLQRQEVVACPAKEVMEKLGEDWRRKGEMQGMGDCRRLGEAQSGEILRSLEVRGTDGQVTEMQVTHDGQILFDASVRPRGTATYTIGWKDTLAVDGRARECMSGLPEYCTAVDAPHGRVWAWGGLYTDRLDDIAWENDRGAYRIYGPAFERSGAKGFGPDVWTKNTPGAEIDRRFRMDIDVKPTLKRLEEAGYKAVKERLGERNTFHIDHGTGLDAYAVGETLGCGGSAIIAGDTLLYPSCWREYEILDNGPLRFTVRLRYADVRVGGRTYREYRIYSLDKGSNFNRVEVWYEEAEVDAEKGKMAGAARKDGERREEEIVVCAGFPLHSPAEHTLRIGDGYMQYADPTDREEANSCELYVGCLFPYDAVRSEARFGHALAWLPLSVGRHFVYYAGAAWSKADVRNQMEWDCRIRGKLEALKKPLTVSIQQ